MEIAKKYETRTLKKRTEEFVLAALHEHGNLSSKDICLLLRLEGFMPWPADVLLDLGMGQAMGRLLTKLSASGQIRNDIQQHVWLLAGDATQPQVSQKLHANTQQGVTRVVRSAYEYQKCGAKFPGIDKDIAENQRPWIEKAREEFGIGK